MKPKVTDIDKLKYWLDSEITILHVMFALVVWLQTHNKVVHILLVLYVIYSILYISVRTGYLVSVDKNYLKVPKQ